MHITNTEMKISFRKILLPVVFSLIIGVCHPLAQDVVITSEQTGEEKIPLGFIQFTGKGEAAKWQDTPDQVLLNDLKFSGRFEMYEFPKIDSNTKKYLNDQQVLAYLFGEYQVTGNKLQFQTRLMDLETDEQILGKKYKGTINDYRQMAHEFADEMVYQLFGEKGIAQTKICYAAKRGGNQQIFAMDYDGAGVMALTGNKSLNVLPAWMGNKADVIFTSYSSGYPNLYKVQVPSKSRSLYIKTGSSNSAIHYNPVDDEIVYASAVKGNTEIFRKSARSGKPVRLTFSSSIETSPRWAPNGYEIVFTSDRAGNPMIYVMDRDGSNIRRLTYEGKYNTSPAWSPKGDRIAFCSMGASGRMDIYTIRPDGSDPVQLTGEAGNNENPSWSPDGRHIVFSSTRSGPRELYVMRADGTKQKRISFSGGNGSPNWSGF